MARTSGFQVLARVSNSAEGFFVRKVKSRNLDCRNVFPGRSQRVEQLTQYGVAGAIFRQREGQNGKRNEHLGKEAVGVGRSTAKGELRCYRVFSRSDRMFGY